MKRSRPNFHWLYITLAVTLIGGFSYLGYKRLRRPEPQYAGIFVVSTPLEYGDTTIQGTLRKDAPIGEVGNYILVLSDGRPAVLDIHGLDTLVDRAVTVSGYLTPSVDGSVPMTMTVSSIAAAAL